MVTEGMRAGSMIKSNWCSYRQHRFGYQNPHGVSQPPLIPVTEDLIPSLGLGGHQTYKMYINTSRQTLIHIKKSKNKARGHLHFSEYSIIFNNNYINFHNSFKKSFAH